ncbi:12735_t:CDS:2, partial [Racocetra persica]
NNDQKTLDNIILSYISEKEANQKTDIQLNQKVLKENTDLNCEIRLSNGYNEKNKVDSQKQSNNDIIDNDNSSGHKC